MERIHSSIQEIQVVKSHTLHAESIASNASVMMTDGDVVEGVGPVREQVVVFLDEDADSPHHKQTEVQQSLEEEDVKGKDDGCVVL